MFVSFFPRPRVFGWSVRTGELAEGLDYSEWLANGRVVGGMVPMPSEIPAQVPAHWRTTIEVDNCAATVDRCVELGGQLALGPLDVVVGTFAQLADPQGGYFGVIELMPYLRGVAD